MLVKLKLLKDWSYEDEDGKAVNLQKDQHEYVSVDPATAKQLEKDGIAEPYTEAKDDGGDPGPKVELPPAMDMGQFAKALEVTVDKIVDKIEVKRNIPKVEIVKDNILDDPKFGFSSLGEQAIAVRKASLPRGQMDERLVKVEKAFSEKAAATTFGSGAVGLDGGFMIAPDFSSQILSHLLREEAILNRCTRITVNGGRLEIPRDVTTPWDSTNGPQVYWTEEGVAITQSKPYIKSINMKLHTLACLVPVTEQLAEDASALDGYLNAKVPEKIAFEVDEAIVDGTGVGQPLGFLKSGSLVSATRTGASTFDLAEGGLMWARMADLNGAEWMMNPGAAALCIAQNNTATGYIGPGGIASAVGGVFTQGYLGYPARVTQHCKGVNTAGDVVFVNMRHYIVAMKSGGITAAESMHMFFDAVTNAFRWHFRIAGQPWIDAAITANNGNSLTYFVALAAA